jgi:hypothetical protein
MRDNTIAAKAAPTRLQTFFSWLRRPFATQARVLTKAQKKQMRKQAIRNHGKAA